MAAKTKSPKSEKRQRVTEKGKHKKDGALKRSFAAMASQDAAAAAGAAAGTAQPIEKSSQSHFVTYLKSTATSKDTVAANKAWQVLQDYKCMTSDQKRCVVQNVFKSGGRKAGLSAIYRQAVSSEFFCKGERMGRMGHTSHDHGFLQGEWGYNKLG